MHRCYSEFLVVLARVEEFELACEEALRLGLRRKGRKGPLAHFTRGQFLFFYSAAEHVYRPAFTASGCLRSK